MQLSVDKLAQLVGGTVEGDGRVLIDRPAKIEEAEPGSISFLGNMKYEPFVYSSQASALLVPVDFTPRRPHSAVLIRVADVYTAIGTLLAAFSPEDTTAVERRISDSARVDESAQLGQRVRVGKFSVVEADTRIGDGCILMDQVYVASNVQIGQNCRFFPGVRIMRDCVIGDNVVIHSNTVVGSDGFGFAPQADGSYEKIPQVGNVVIEDQVEIGANCVLDRAAMGSTFIRRGVKMDNLIQVGHNVDIGANTVIAAQTGIAGSTKIGENCKIGGQTGFAGHLSIADYSNFQAQSGIMQKITEPGGSYFGSPAIAYRDYMKSSVVFKQLPDLAKKVARLEKQLKALDKE